MTTMPVVQCEPMQQNEACFTIPLALARPIALPKIERAASMFLQRTSNCANMIHSEENEKSLCGTMRSACA